MAIEGNLKMKCRKCKHWIWHPKDEPTGVGFHHCEYIHDSKSCNSLSGRQAYCGNNWFEPKR